MLLAEKLYEKEDENYNNYQYISFGKIENWLSRVFVQRKIIDLDMKQWPCHAVGCN